MFTKGYQKIDDSDVKEASLGIELHELQTEGRGNSSSRSQTGPAILGSQQIASEKYKHIFLLFSMCVFGGVIVILYVYYQNSNVRSVAIFQTSMATADRHTLLDVNVLNARGLLVQSTKFGNSRCSDASAKRGECRQMGDDSAIAFIDVDSSKKFQKILGFGGAFTEASAYNFYRLPKSMQEKVIQLYFSEEGAGFTLGRVHINSCDFSLQSYSFNDIAGDYALEYFDMEVTHDNAQLLPLLRLARFAIQSRNKNVDSAASTKDLTYDLKLLASPWSPPAWMKKPLNGKQSMVGSAEPMGLIDTDRVKTAWATYITKWVTAYKNKGIPIWAVTPQNEPEFAAPWEACSYNASSQLHFVTNYLGPILKQSFPDILLLAFDHNKDHLLAWTKTILGDKAAAGFVDGMAFHWYAGEGDRMLDGTYGYEAINDSYHFVGNKEKIFLATEGCSCPGISVDNWLRAERLSHDIIYDLENYAQGWIDWNLLVDSNGGPNHLGNVCDAAMFTLSDYSDVHLQPKYYYFTHISKHFLPNSVRVYSNVLGNYNFANIDPNVRVGLELGLYGCERSTRQIWRLNDVQRNSTLELVKPSTDSNVDVYSPSYVRLCAGTGNTNRPYLRLVDCEYDMSEGLHRRLTVEYSDIKEHIVDVYSGMCLTVANNVRTKGGIFKLAPCVEGNEFQRMALDPLTGEITMKVSESVPFCLTAGWPMLSGVAALRPDGKVALVISNEASVDTEVLLRDKQTEADGSFKFMISGRAIQTLVY